MDTKKLRVYPSSGQQRRGCPPKVDSFKGKVSVVKCIQRASTERLDTALGQVSEAEVKLLQKNGNVACVNEREAMFTEAFKRLAWEEKQSGRNLPAIFRENGIDPQILGHKRIENFSRRLREKARNNANFSDERKMNQRPSEKCEANDLEEKVKAMPRK